MANQLEFFLLYFSLVFLCPKDKTPELNNLKNVPICAHFSKNPFLPAVGRQQKEEQQNLSPTTLRCNPTHGKQI